MIMCNPTDESGEQVNNDSGESGLLTGQITHSAKHDICKKKFTSILVKVWKFTRKSM